MRFAFTRDSKYLVTAGKDGHVRAWRTNDWSCVVARDLGKPVLTMAFLPADGRVVVGIGHDWKVTELEILRLQER